MADDFEIDPADVRMFRRSVGHVRPVKYDTLPRTRRKPRPQPGHSRFSKNDELAVMHELLHEPVDYTDMDTGDELLYMRPGFQTSTFRKLRRGRFTVENELDLHGMTVAMAQPALHSFLQQVHARNQRCVRIVHGRGLRSRNGKPVLKQKVAIWLRRRKDVLAFCSARPTDGGTGAIYVLLRRHG